LRDDSDMLICQAEHALALGRSIGNSGNLFNINIERVSGLERTYKCERRE
jgi:hypothetical protein